MSDTHSSRGLRIVLNVAKVRMFPGCVSHRLRHGMGSGTSGVSCLTQYLVIFSELTLGRCAWMSMTL